MKESVTYQEILEEGFEKGIEKGIERGIEKGETKGRISEARSFILRSGTRKCGPPDAVTSQRLESIDDVPILEALMDRMLDTGLTTWAELLPPTA